MDLGQSQSLFWRFFLLTISSLGLSACMPGTSSDGGSAAPVQAQESAYCTTRENYPSGIPVSGNVEFEYRVLNPSEGLGNPTSAGVPFAEVVVTNSAGVIVQCGETDATGAVALTIPDVVGAYHVAVKSRAFNDKLRVSVIEDYWNNQPYSLSKSVAVGNTTTNINFGTILARARQTDSAKIEGGAFNILYQVWRANEYLRSTLSDPNFVATKVSAYWRMGHNPYNYFGGTKMLSFYRPGYKQLFILGGDKGNVKIADTDHFDNSVILHEYGHFLEDIYAQSDSPGGMHNGNFIIDPRLAWSEGWANFFQAAVLSLTDPTWKYYIDTVGFRNDMVEGGSGSIAIKFDLTMTNGRCAADIPFVLFDCDKVAHNGEGTFREVSISRHLFKTIMPVVDGGAAVPFSALWKSFADTESAGQPSGLASSQVRFRNVARFNEFLRANILAHHASTEADWNSVVANEKQNVDRQDYAAPLVTQAQNTCALIALAPVVDQEDALSKGSNLLRSSDFYEFNHNGQGGTLRLEYADGSQHIDLDLFIYTEGHVLQETWESENGSIVLRSARRHSVEQGVEAVSLAGLRAGSYLINIKAYTYNKTSGDFNAQAAHYRLTLEKNGVTEDLCPAP